MVSTKLWHAGTLTIAVLMLAGGRAFPCECDSVTITNPHDGGLSTFNANPKNMSCECDEEGDCDTEWSCEDIAGVTESWPSGNTGSSVTLRFTNLPTYNSGFGPTWVKADADDCSDSVTFDLFFPEEAKSHPGGGTPNWYYYWYQTTAKYGTPYYDPGSAVGHTNYVDGAWRAYVGYNDNEGYTPPDGDNKHNHLDGIDHFAWVCRHEARHVTTLTWWWPGGYPLTGDNDDDLLPDTSELPDSAALGGTWENPQSGGPFEAGDEDTNNDGWIDGENYVMCTQVSWNEGSADSQDWANPGHQYE